MTRKDSVLYCTGQAWKFWVMPIGVVISALLIFGAQWLIGSLPAGWFPIITLSGCLVGLVSFVFPCIAIKCPVCGARWFWLAVSKKHSTNWFNWLMTQSSCPACGTSCHKFTENHVSGQ